MPDHELEQFKTDINLTEYAASQGYAVIPRESSRNSVVMCHSHGDKVIIARGQDQHWIYFSVRNNQDNGSIVDFIQNRQHASLGDVRKILRSWLDGGTSRPLPSLFVQHVEPSSKDHQAGY